MAKKEVKQKAKPTPQEIDKMLEGEEVKETKKKTTPEEIDKMLEGEEVKETKKKTTKKAKTEKPITFEEARKNLEDALVVFTKLSTEELRENNCSRSRIYGLISGCSSIMRMKIRSKLNPKKLGYRIRG